MVHRRSFLKTKTDILYPKSPENNKMCFKIHVVHRRSLFKPKTDVLHLEKVGTGVRVFRLVESRWWVRESRDGRLLSRDGSGAQEFRSFTSRASVDQA